MKEEMKRAGTYTPETYREWKRAQGWMHVTHGQRKPRKWRVGTVTTQRLAASRSRRMHGGVHRGREQMPEVAA